MDIAERQFGIIGLGSMGSGIAQNLARAGYRIAGFDLRPEAVEELVAAGGSAAANVEDILARCDTVLTCVEGMSSIALADTVLLPGARPGQTFIDHSTVPCPQTRRIGAAFEAKGCRYLDAPISGGKQGAADGALRIFVGGEKSLAEEYWPMFSVIGNIEKVVYCGGIGMGQAAKVVQQLTTRFPDVARLEVLAFGLRAGLDLGTVEHALDLTPGTGDPYEPLCNAIRKGRSTEAMAGLFSEWKYYLEEAQASGFRLPMLEAMYEFCKDEPKTEPDPLGRMQPSIWNTLMSYREDDETND